MSNIIVVYCIVSISIPSIQGRAYGGVGCGGPGG